MSGFPLLLEGLGLWPTGRLEPVISLELLKYI